jgi:hypothetical protein
MILAFTVSEFMQLLQNRAGWLRILRKNGAMLHD